MKIRTEVAFEERNGRVLSKRKEFYENGKLYREGLYSKGQGSWDWNIPIGLIRSFSENGNILSEEIFDESGSRHGESKYYSRKGELEKIILYHAGKITSEKNMK